VFVEPGNDKMEFPEGVVLLDSLGDVKPENTSPILVCGSHCGGNLALARQVKNCHFKAVFLNNAGIGKNNAGIRGLLHYEAEGVIACAVDRNSAEIGIAFDAWEGGIISHINDLAKTAGIEIGDSIQTAVAKISPKINSASKNVDSEVSVSEPEGRIELKVQSQTQITGKNITVTDSITFLNERNAGDIVVCGSHGIILKRCFLTMPELAKTMQAQKVWKH